MATYLHIEQARLQAKKSIMHAQHGCILLYNGKIIAVGYNQYKGTYSSNIKECPLCG